MTQPITMDPSLNDQFPPTTTTSPPPNNISEAINDIHPITVLIDELRNDDTQFRLRSMKQLYHIALALGPERTRDELLPFLGEAVYDEDEILLAMCNQLATFVPYVGGKAYAYSLLVPLESLCATEDNVVRDTAAQTLADICTNHLPQEHVESHFLPLIKRLSQGEWFTTRCSSCTLFAAAYPNLSISSQNEIRVIFQGLCSDDTPMVRRAAASKLAGLIQSISKSSSPEPSKHVRDLLSIFNQLIEDDQDSVRLATIPTALAFIDALPAPENFKTLLPVFLDFIADKSWRVRHVIAEKFSKFLEKLYQQDEEDALLNAFQSLLQDSESEVRTAAAENISEFCMFLCKKQKEEATKTAWIKNDLMPLVHQLAHDPNQNVKAAVAKSIMELTTVVGKDFTIDELLPLFLSQLRDDSTEVRLNVIANLSNVDGVIGSQQLSESLLPAIMELADDSKWRVRLAIVAHIPLLAEQLGAEEFEKRLAELSLTLLTDPVFAIRDAAVQNIKKLVQIFGAEWTEQKVIPIIINLSKDSNYLRRMTCLFTITQIICGSFDTINSMLPLILSLSTDKIPNVRFNVARSIETIYTYDDAKNKTDEPRWWESKPTNPSGGATGDATQEKEQKNNTNSGGGQRRVVNRKLFEDYEEEIKTVLKSLKSDTDDDVAFFADQALTTVFS